MSRSVLRVLPIYVEVYGASSFVAVVCFVFRFDCVMYCPELWSVEFSCSSTEYCTEIRLSVTILSSCYGINILKKVSSLHRIYQQSHAIAVSAVGLVGRILIISVKSGMSSKYPVYSRWEDMRNSIYTRKKKGKSCIGRTLLYNCLYRLHNPKISCVASGSSTFDKPQTF